jgi:hypothetical protein
MAYYGYFTHWDTQGYKPYMRYTLLGGSGSVAENVGLSYCTTSPATADMVTVSSCSLATIENALNNSEWQMFYNDFACCGNGHRDNILNPFHNRVSIGIAWNTTTSAVYLVEDFENSYFSNFSIQQSGGTVRISAETSQYIDLREASISVYYDPPPSNMTLNELDLTGAYGPGTFAGSVFPPCPTGFICSSQGPGTNVYASQWTTTPDISIVFSIQPFIDEYGPGVYTLYLLPSQNPNDSLTSISIFIK